MKIKYLILLILFTIVSCSKIEKDVADYYPVVRTNSVELFSDGSVEVVGEIVSEGNYPLYFVGFCMDTLPNPKLHVNQKTVDTLFGNYFRVRYSTLNFSKPYYFKAFAANEYGYHAGEPISIDSIVIVAPNIPCDPLVNTITFQNEFYTKDYSYQTIFDMDSETKLTANVNNTVMEINFGVKPITGVYDIVSDVAYGEYTIAIKYDFYKAEKGAKAYVTQLDDENYELVICNASIYDGNFTSSMKTKIQAEYYK